MPTRQQDLQEKRIESILGDPEEIDFDEARDIYYQYLKENLDLPCEVTGIEDFSWEEIYDLYSIGRSVIALTSIHSICCHQRDLSISVLHRYVHRCFYMQKQDGTSILHLAEQVHRR